MATPSTTQSAESIASSYDHADVSTEDFNEVQVSTTKPKTEDNEAGASATPTTPPKAKDGRFRSTSLARLAKRFKIADEDYAEMTDEQVEAAIDQIAADRDSREVNDRHQRVESNNSNGHTGIIPPTQTAPVAEVEETFDWGKDEETGQNFTDDDVGPATRNQLKSLLKRVANLEKGVNFVTSAERSRQQETVHSKLDRLFDDLQSPTLFGDKGGAEYESDSPERLRRDAILAAVAKAGVTRVADKNFATEFKKAAAILYPQAKGTNGHAKKNGETKDPATATNGNGNGKDRKLSSFRLADDDDDDPDYTELLQERKRQWQEGQLSRPNAGPASQEPRGRARAEKNLRRNMQEMGMADEDGRLADGLPD